MADRKYKPAPHDHEALIAEAYLREGFAEAYEALASKYQLVSALLCEEALAEDWLRPEEDEAWQHLQTESQ